ncbi:DUF2726 domain-containing protein [Leptothrix discophora]|uniref:DUF2726 domain-containing protein n=1 Tax=Leptothrix discophora TaxID=89 RepID=A0ABT9FZW0_LEPDI|nr:DUF2726 domain-containing protein [Leptothrix discophora]MDP4299767.1 DUF2726 domain-containing protein [Leptothrix discophora]
MHPNVWISVAIALTAVTLLALAGLLLWRRPGSASAPRSSRQQDLPTDWPLVQRPIFSTEERALFRQLRTALPHHTVLAKVPLVRFSQPQNRDELAYWFKLLGPIHVSFVVCAENGRVLAALDVERPDRPAPKRHAIIKQAVLEACRVRYVKCMTDHLPSAAELQMLVPNPAEASRPLVPRHVSDNRTTPRTTLAHTLRAGNGAAGSGGSQWYESGFSGDSFFAPESQRDPLADDAPGSWFGSGSGTASGLVGAAASGRESLPAGKPSTGAGGTWAGQGGTSAGASAGAVAATGASSGAKGPGGAPRTSSGGRIRRSEDFGAVGDTAGHIIGRP